MSGRGLVLVVEDESAIADLERLYLTRDGFGVHLESDGSAALASIRTLRPVVVLLDVGIPGLDGIELVRRLRAEGDWTPVIFVTARDDEVDRILGLELGADDYVTKPFSPRELVARVRALVRRQSTPGEGVREVGGVVLDPRSRSVRVDDRRIELTAIEFDLLAQLFSQPGRVFTREQLLSLVWGVADYSGSRTVDVHVGQVRAKLGPHGGVIRTSRGVGYSAADD